MVNINIEISKEGDQYIAIIKDGWWIARGKTRKKAIKRVLSGYLGYLDYKEKPLDAGGR